MTALLDFKEEVSRRGLRPMELLNFLDDPHELDETNTRDRAALYEAEFTAKQLGMMPNDRFFRDIGMPPPKMAGGSFITGTSGELLYSSVATGTQLNTFTTEDNLMKALPYCIIPAGFFYNSAATGKSLRVKAIGRLGTTSTPTFTFSVRLLTSSTWSAAGIVFSSAAITAGSGVTLAPFILDIEMIFRALATGAASTIAVMGEVRGGTALAAGGGVYSIPGANTAFTAATYDNSVTNYLFLSVACGTSNASNLAQLEMVKVYGEN